MESVVHIDGDATHPEHGPDLGAGRGSVLAGPVTTAAYG